jgi:hypothetical protein
MSMQGSVPVKDALPMQPLMEPVVGALQRGTKLLGALGLGTRGERIDIGDGALDLFQHGHGVGLHEERFVVDELTDSLLLPAYQSRAA